jgi:Pyruvate/2-oxoglutarate dehydrogenase complex, dihydrolipoamide acyltransferase (E2) component, and related enzymes
VGSTTLDQHGFFHIGDVFAKEVNRNYLYFVIEVNATRMDEQRLAARQAGAPVPSYTAFAIHAIGNALRHHPDLNCMIRDLPFFRGLAPLDDITATVAVEREVENADMVLAVPIRGVDQKSLVEIQAELRKMADVDIVNHHSVRELVALNKLAKWAPLLAQLITFTPRISKAQWQKYRGGSFVVTSPAKYGGADMIIPTWPWPLTAAFGVVKPRPVVENGQVVARNTMLMTLAADRRLANGAPLARFAERIRKLLEEEPGSAG